jgi:ATP-binding cassette subfamily B (MDR/TAP) protein 1
MTGGEVMTVFFSVIMGAFALGQSMPPLEQFSKGRGACAKIYDTIARTPLIENDTGKELESVKGDIELKNVSFSYPTRKEAQVLDKFSIKIKAGTRVALVGHSGCGKSSTVSLIQRFYDPDQGKVKLDGHNLKKLNVTWLRKQVLYIDYNLLY